MQFLFEGCSRRKNSTTKNNVTYEVLSSDSKTAKVTGLPGNGKVTAVTVEDTVTIARKEYTVTQIADSAFKGNTDLKSVTLGSNVTAVGEKAFSGFINNLYLHRRSVR